jgi:GH35 family endo-1,4-beta-xylanase
MIRFARFAAIAGALALLALTLAPPGLAFAAEEGGNLPEGGVSVLSADALFEATFRNPDALPVEGEVVNVADQPFGRALRVRTERPTERWWAIQLLLPTVAPVRKGDALLTTFYIRGIETEDETGEAYLRTFFQRDEPPWEKSMLARWGAAKKWRMVRCPFNSLKDYSPGEAAFTFAFGTGPQVIEIGGLTLSNYGKAVSVDDLPRSARTYAGREPDAPWRADARQRIDKIRKGDLLVSVKTADGEPVAGAQVSVKMTRHAFPFGTAAAVASDNGRRYGRAYGETYWFTPEDEEKYDYWLQRLFNKITPETALMTNGWTGYWPFRGRDAAIKGVKRYRAMGFPVRGHILVWPSWKYFHLPGIENVKDNPEVLGRMVLDHIADEAGTLKDMVFEWTVLNEPFTHHDVIDVLGRDAMVDWFKAAREASPKAKLYINDFGILSGGGLDHGHQDHYSETIQFLLDKGAPVDGIGLQGHFGDDVTPPEKVHQLLDRYAAFGRDLMITEFDINTTNRAIQADYTRDFMTVCFSHPAVVGFDLWGFWERAHWRPDGALIDNDWNLKPNGEAYVKLVLDEWWTDVEGTTRQDGTLSVRGFLGDYRVTVRRGAESKEYTLRLPLEGTTLEVVW